MLILPAFFIYMLVIFPSGSQYCFNNVCGIYFWGVHGHDAVWHLAIANVSFSQIPFIAPTFAGDILSGYNYFLDLIIHLISLAGIPAITLYFKVMPVAWFIIYTALLIALGRRIKNDPVFVGLLLFFAYFAESFAYILNLMHQGTVWGSSGLLATLKVHMMSNPPFAWSILILLAMLIIIRRQKIDLKIVLILGLLNFLNLGLKFYGGAVTGFLTGLFLLFTLVRTDIKKMFLYGFIQLFFAVAAILFFYDPFNSLKTGAIFTVAPFALIHTITEEPNLFYMRHLTDARYFLVSRGIGPRLIAIELFNLTLFVFFYFGVKFFGLIYVAVKILRRKINRFDWYLLLTMVFATALTVTFVQKAEWWNVIQFFYYAMFLSVFFTAELMYGLWKAKKRKLVAYSLLVVIIILALPVTVDVVKQYAVFPGTAYISEDELAGLNFLKKQPYGVVFAPLYDPAWKTYGEPDQLYRYTDTAYVAAFTDKPVYFANILQLRLTGVNYENRLKKMNRLDCGILKKVDYVYEIRHLPNEGKLLACPGTKSKKLFGNQAVFVYSITK